MEDEEKVDLGCSFLGTVFSLLLVSGPLYIIYNFFYKTYQFLLKPDVLARSLEIFGETVMFFGACSLLMWVIQLLPPDPRANGDEGYSTTGWFEKIWMSPIAVLIFFLFVLGFLFFPIFLVYSEVIAPQLKRWTSQYRDGRSE